MNFYRRSSEHLQDPTWEAPWLAEVSHDIIVDEFLLNNGENQEEFSRIDKDLEIDWCSWNLNLFEEAAEAHLSLLPPCEWHPPGAEMEYA